MQQREIIINRLMANPDGSLFGFGETLDGEGVYLATASLKRRDVSEGQTYQAILDVNKNDKHGTTPWFCIGVIIEDASPRYLKEQEEVPEPLPEATKIERSPEHMREQIVQILSKAERPMTARQLGVCIDYDPQKTQSFCKTLHTAGRIASVSLRQSQDAKASFMAYLANDRIKEIFEELVMFDEEVAEAFL